MHRPSSIGFTGLIQVYSQTIHQGPCITRETETRLSGSRVGNNNVVDHRSRWPVLSPLRNCVDRHVWAYWSLGCKPWRWMPKDISINRPNWMGFDDLKHTVSCRFTRWRRCNIAEHWQPWELRGLQAAWNQAQCTMKLDIDKICVAGSSPWFE